MTTQVRFLSLTCLLSFDNILNAVVCHTVFIMFTNVLLCFYFDFSNYERDLGFSLVLDMRGNTWQGAKPMLKALQVLHCSENQQWLIRTAIGKHVLMRSPHLFVNNLPPLTSAMTFKDQDSIKTNTFKVTPL